MKSQTCLAVLLVVSFASVVAFRSEALAADRTVPVPLADHPGNIFLVGDEVHVSVPKEVADRAATWKVLDDVANPVDQGEIGEEKSILVPNLGIGWYRIEFLDRRETVIEFTTAAVLARLASPVPKKSPVCLDAALSWDPNNATDGPDLTRVAALAGMNWIRDRLHWREMEPSPGEFAEEGKYDLNAARQSAEGMRVLQTFHGTPQWAVEGGGRRSQFPGDYRHAYRFCEAMAKRFKGNVEAWEPWNEANAANFGGHTIDEMCSFQKACYLGFKAGDPEVTVCWNACGGVNTPGIAKGVLENETWPYYETYNIHSYDWPHAYEKLWEPSRQAACGRPIWVTECDRGMKAETGLPWGDFSREDDQRKAQFIAHSYACSLFSGAQRHFHFLLRHYMEQHASIQFGLLRVDKTPRPSFSAVAAVGRFLAGAKCLGRFVVDDDPDIHVYAFRASPDGVERDVLVAWTENPFDWPKRGSATADWPLPESMNIESVYDYLGRPLGNNAPEMLTSSAVFALLPPGEAEKLPLVRKPLSEYREGNPSSAVLQLRTSRDHIVKRQEAWTQEHERTAKPGEETELEIVAYNFDAEPIEGTVRLEEAPTGWGFVPESWDLSLASMARQSTTARLLVPASAENAEPGLVKLRGSFGEAGEAVLAFRVFVSDY